MEDPEGKERPLASIVTGLAVATGWLLHDLIRVLVSSQPGAFTGLIPGALVALLLGGVFGWIAFRWPAVLKLVLGGAALAAIALAGIENSIPDYRAWLPRVVFLLASAYWASRWLTPRAGAVWAGAVRAGLCLGFSACHLAIWFFARDQAMHWTIGLTGLAALGVGLARPAWVRWALTILLILYPCARVRHVRGVFSANQRRDAVPVDVRPEPGPSAPNLLLVVMDTVRYDRIGAYGYERGTTPRLDEFVREHTTQYDNARSSGSYTLPSHASMLTGLYSAEHGADHPRSRSQEVVPRDHRRPAVGLRANVPTLGESLRARGYRTGAVIANSAYLHHAFGLDRGFDHYDARDGAWFGGYLTLPQFFGWGLRIGAKVFRDGDAITDQALEWMDSGDQERPFFLLVNYMDAHGPLIPPLDTANAFSAVQPVNMFDPNHEEMLLLYDRCMLALDARLGRLLAELEASGRLDETAVIITADHGEALGEHEYWSHAWTLYDELVHVPLFVKPAGGRTVEFDDQLVAGVDIPRLAFEALGLPPDPALVRDRSALAEASGLTSEWYHGKTNPDIDRWAAATGRDLSVDLVAWIDSGTKFIVSSSGEVQAFDLERDPYERTPLTLAPEVHAAALTRAQTWWSKHPPLTPSEDKLEAGVLQRLEDLGYIGE